MEILERQKIGTFRDMIEGGEGSDFLEIGEIIDENSIAANNFVVNVKSNKGDNIKFKMSEYSDVNSMKEDLFKDHIEGGSKIRLLLNGRLLKDEDSLKTLKIDNNAQMQAFISPSMNFEVSGGKVELVEGKSGLDESGDEETENGEVANMANFLGDSRGFDFFKIHGYTDAEIIWKRYTFHASYILSEKLDLINDDQLFILEECFLTDNPRLLKKPELFKFCEFRPEKRTFLLFLQKVKRVLVFLLGMVLGVPALMAFYRMDVKEEYKNAFILGAVSQMLVFVTVFGNLFSMERS